MSDFSVVARLTADASGMQTGLKDAEKAIRGLESTTSGVTKKTGGMLSNLGTNIKSFAGAGLVIKGITSAFSAFTDGLDAGINRFDTMEKFPKMMEQMGYSTQESTDAIDKLVSGIEGLPTALDDIVGTTQLLTMMTGDLDEASSIALGMNNAFLASGASAADTSRGMQQFNQMLAKGKVDMQSWNTLVETMSPSLRTLNKEMGYAENDAYAIYDALQAGEITFNDFTDAVIRASEAQGGFADMALENSKGIRTSIQNLKTAFGRGWANILKSIDNGLRGFGLDGITGFIDSFKPLIDNLFNFATQAIDRAFKAVKVLVNVFNDITQQVKTFLKPAQDLIKKFTGPFSKGIKNVASELGNFKSGVKETVKLIGRGQWGRAWERFVNSFSQLREGIGKSIENVNKAILRNFNVSSWGQLGQLAISSIGQGMSNAVNNIGNIAGAIQDFIFQTTGAESWGDIAGLILQGIGNYIKWRIDLIGDVAGAIQDFVFTQLEVESWSEAGQVIMTAIGDALQTAGSFIGDVAEPILSWISQKINSIEWGEVAQSIGDGIAGAINFTLDITGKVLSWIGEQIDKVNFSAVGKGLGDAVGGAISFVADVSEDIFNWISGQLDGIEWGDIGEDIGGFISGAISSISEWDIDLHSLSDAILDAIWDAIMNTPANIGDFLQGAIRGLLNDGQMYIDMNGQEISINPDGAVYSIDGIPVVSMDEWQVSLDDGTVVATNENPHIDLTGVTAQATGVDVELTEGDLLAQQLTDQFNAMGWTVDVENVKANIQAYEVEMGNIAQTIYEAYKALGEPNIDIEQVKLNPAGYLINLQNQGVEVDLKEHTFTIPDTIEVKPAGFSMNAYNVPTEQTGGVAPEVKVDEINLTSSESTTVNGLSDITELISGQSESWSGIFDDTMTRMAESVRQGMTMIQQAIAGGMTSSRNTLQGGVNSWIAVLNSARDSAYVSGQNFVNGFRSGMASMLQSVINTATGIGNAASSALSRSIREASPAKVPMASGRNFTLGYAIGIGQESRAVSKAVQGIASQSINPLNNITAGATFKNRNLDSGSFVNNKLDQLINAVEQGQVMTIDGRAFGRTTSKYSDLGLGHDAVMARRHKL